MQNVSKLKKATVRTWQFVIRSQVYEKFCAKEFYTKFHTGHSWTGIKWVISNYTDIFVPQYRNKNKYSEKQWKINETHFPSFDHPCHGTIDEVLVGGYLQRRHILWHCSKPMPKDKCKSQEGIWHHSHRQVVQKIPKYRYGLPELLNCDFSVQYILLF